MRDAFDRERSLEGMRILIAEDEILIATDMEDTFREAGAEVVTASSLPDALVGAEDPALTAAVLDARLGQETSEAVAEVLTRRGVPFFFHSGFQLPDGMREKYGDRPVLLKPVRASDFVAALLEMTR